MGKDDAEVKTAGAEVAITTADKHIKELQDCLQKIDGWTEQSFTDLYGQGKVCVETLQHDEQVITRRTFVIDQQFFKPLVGHPTAFKSGPAMVVRCIMCALLVLTMVHSIALYRFEVESSRLGSWEPREVHIKISVFCLRACPSDLRRQSGWYHRELVARY